VEEGRFDERDRAMIRLHQNTLAVAAEARAAGRETQRIARTLDRAADAQSAAVAALRAQPIRPDDAAEAEERSLELLKEALTSAEEMQQQLEEQEARRRREELIAAYRDFAEREVALRSATADLAALGELDRRAIVEARRLGNQQEEIRAGVDDLRARTQEISESLVFTHVHGLIDEWALAAADGLRNGDVGLAVTDAENRIAHARLAEALEEEQQRQDEFAEGNQGEGGGGGGGGSGGAAPLVPPIAELKLLRGIQEQVYHETRETDAREDMPDADRRQRLRDLSRRQRELHELGRRLAEALQGGPPEQGSPPDAPPQDTPPDSTGGDE
jgi:hypothetical protein